MSWCSKRASLISVNPGGARSWSLIILTNQGYPSELIEVIVKGVPSMHICLDFLQELMQQPSLNKQIFAIQLLSHLCIQYALPKSLNLCIMALNLLYALLGSTFSLSTCKYRKQSIFPCRSIQQPKSETVQADFAGSGQDQRGLPAPRRRHRQPHDATGKGLRVSSFIGVAL
jgi:hypothetical protein